MLPLPYGAEPPHLEPPKPLQEMSLADWEAHGAAERALRHGALLRRFAADVPAIGGVAAACLLEQGGHHGVAQSAMFQMEDGRRFLYAHDDPKGPDPQRFPQDLPALLPAVLVEAGNTADGGGRGRCRWVHVILLRANAVVAAEWFEVTGLLLGGRYKSTAMNRLLLEWERVWTAPGDPLDIELYD